MVDLPLSKTMLQCLANAAAGGLSDYTEELLALDTESVLRRPISTATFRSTLQQFADRSWAKASTDPWGLPTWSITEAGKEQLRRM
jgi:hypothetical protein